MNDRLYRSRDDRILAGVAAGVADRLDLDPALIRVLWVVLTPLTGGFLLLLYIVMAVVVPKEPDELEAPGPGPAPGSAQAAWSPPSPQGAASQPATAGPSGAASTPPAGSLAAPAAWTPPSSTDWRSARQSERERRRAERLGRRADRRARRDPTGGLILGLGLILIGAFFLARSYIPEIDWDHYWPIALIVLGALLLAGSVRRTPGEPRG